MVWLLLPLAAACSRHVEAHFEDAQLVVRVKTAIVNDPAIGAEPIEVEATAGVVSLLGRVATATAADRAVALARAVEGVREVRSRLVVEPVTDDERESPSLRSGLRARTGGAAEPAEPRRPLFGVGAALDLQVPSSDALDNRVSVRPTFVWRRSAGFGPAIGFGWFPSDLAASASDRAVSGTLRVRPVMGGIDYTVLRGDGWITGSVVAGVSLNAISPSESEDVAVRAIAVDRSFAWRPGVRAGYFLSPRLSLDGSLGYVITRPRVTFLGDDGLESRAVRADALQLRINLAYWPF